MAPQRICSIPGCGKRVQARGWCGAHYMRWHTHGDPLAGGPSPTVTQGTYPVACSIPGCGKPACARGWCYAHWDRWRHYGDPLATPIGTSTGEPMRYFRDEVLAYDGDDCLIWPYARTSAGYGHMNVDGANHLVSRLVCTEEFGPPPSPQHEAAHQCGNGHLGCVAKRHLSWKTPVSNAADKVEHGTDNRADLTSAQIREIRALRGVVSQAEIGARFGIHQGSVSRIQLGKSWADVPD